MNRLPIRNTLFCALVALCLPVAAAPRNIALNAPYQLDPAPGYEQCTDPGDATQLTDGKYVEGYFWTQPGAVGWTNAKPVLITVDLGKDQPISGASFNTAAGVAGVAWPTAIFVFVAGDDKAWHSAGELIGLSAANGLPPAEGYAVHRYQTDALKTHGRYVAFGVWSVPFTFVDEVEVYEGDPASLATPLEGAPIAELKAYMSQVATYEGVMRRLRNDIAAVKEKADAASPEVKSAVQAELDAVTKALPTVDKQYDASFKTILPLNDLHAQIFRAYSKVLIDRNMNKLPMFISWAPSNPYEFLPLLAEPPKAPTTEMTVHMMQNEYRAAAMNFTNAAERDISVDIDVTGMPGGANPAWITLHEVLWTDTGSGEPVAAALKPAPPGARLSADVPRGMTRQVWLTFHPTEVEPGTYKGGLLVHVGDKAIQHPLTVTVYPITLPDKPRLHLGGWDYTDQPSMYQATPENRQPLINHLREHFVDSPWATSAVLPYGKYDAAGAMTEPPDTALFDAWLALWPTAAQYLVFPSVGGECAGLKMGTPEFARAVGEWVKFWANHAKERGVQPAQLGLLLVDEPYKPEMDAVIIAWARAIRAADTGIRIWEDPTYKNMAEANQEMVPACHVACPNRQIFVHADPAYRDYYVQQRDKGVDLEFYSCSGPARLLDPYSYYRLQAWTCWQYGAKSMYFWAYGDGGGAFSFNEYLCKNAAYTPLFIEPDSVMPAKQMEAIREGVEDYEYLAMLRDAVNSAPANAPALPRARALLDEAPHRVLDPMSTFGFQWKKEQDRTIADSVRIEILETLTALKNP